MNKILVLDIETTGFSHSKNHIVEVGIVSLDLDSGERKILFDKVVIEESMTKEELEKSWIIEKGWMNVDEILDSGSLNGYHSEIQDILNTYPLGATAFNSKFDNGFLKHRGFNYKELPCPMLLSTNVCKLRGKYGSYKWPKVQEAYDYFFAPHDYIEQHRGADDAFHEAQIVHELYKRGIFKV